MTVILIIVLLVMYFAIGAILTGLYNGLSDGFIGFDAIGIFFWPVLLVMWAIFLFALAFRGVWKIGYKLGCRIKRRILGIKEDEKND